MDMFQVRGIRIVPLLFDIQEIDLFIRDYRCSECLNHLEKIEQEDGKWSAYCNLHGPIYEHNHIDATSARIQKKKLEVARADMFTPVRGRTEKQILEELGF